MTILTMNRRFLLTLAALFAFVSCTTTVIPPASVTEPEIVMLVTHGKSSSLLLPDGNERAVRWAFGDWRYYAEGETGPRATIAAALIPTPAALGRQVVDPAPDAANELIDSLRIGVDEAFPIRVERTAVARLQARLSSIFEANRETLLYNPGPRLEFIRHPQPYTLVNSSNRKVAEWLRELGCAIDGVPLLSRWRVEREPIESVEPNPTTLGIVRPAVQSAKGKSEG